MSIAVLIEAADFLERREREAEHGYAIVSVVPTQRYQKETKLKVSKQLKAKRSFNHRSLHNELEKNRRAHLRSCLERLREEVPPSPDVNKATTLGLLTRAKDYIRYLEDKDRMNTRYKEQLSRERQLLTERLRVLTLSWRTPQTASDSCSLSSWSSASSGYCTESPDSDESGGSLSPPASDGGSEDVARTSFRMDALSVRIAGKRRGQPA